MAGLRVFITILANKGRMGAWVCGVSIRVMCYSTNRHVMLQARDDFEGFLKAHMTDEEKVIVHMQTSLPM